MFEGITSKYYKCGKLCGFHWSAEGTLGRGNGKFSLYPTGILWMCEMAHPYTKDRGRAFLHPGSSPASAFGILVVWSILLVLEKPNFQSGVNSIGFQLGPISHHKVGNELEPQWMNVRTVPAGRGCHHIWKY